MWSTLFFPLIPAIVKIVVIEFSIVVHFCLSDLGEKTNDGYYQFLAVSYAFSKYPQKSLS